jgi:hypothetical protein
MAVEIELEASHKKKAFDGHENGGFIQSNSTADLVDDANNRLTADSAK